MKNNAYDKLSIFYRMQLLWARIRQETHFTECEKKMWVVKFFDWLSER